MCTRSLYVAVWCACWPLRLIVMCKGAVRYCGLNIRRADRRRSHVHDLRLSTSEGSMGLRDVSRMWMGGCQGLHAVTCIPSMDVHQLGFDRLR
jgi:hypothetical protein